MKVCFKKKIIKIRVCKIAPIGVVMLPEALAFVAKLQHLNGKRDRYFYYALMLRFKKLIQNALLLFCLDKHIK